ncbi:hypothetical protein [Stieleria varia]|uniref:Uncharacterized protein n=1 Tax=Stieleria varia TaxID=2528005 RepID=A0A5C6A5C3_9BACT|nr:hypothetical protein [Stieleria varia]TWT94577.1 hypothetical protein Pla52n_53980 [Stieleria varia]
MTKQHYRSIGAIIGLAIGATLMYLVGQGGVMPLAICGATGAVAGGMTGERIYNARNPWDEGSEQ